MVDNNNQNDTTSGENVSTIKSLSRRDAIKISGTTVVTGFAGCLGGSGGGGGEETATSGGQEEVTTTNGGGGEMTTTGGSGETTTDGSGTTGGSGSFESTEIVFWHGEAEENPKSAIDSAIQAFNEEYDNIQATAEVVNERQISNQVIAGSQTGTLPNVIEANSKFMGQVATANLLSTDAAAQAVEEIGQDSFLDGPTAWAQTEDGFMMVPYYAFVNSFWYRKSVFNENDLSAPNTWEALRSSAETLTNADQDQYGIAFGTEKHNFTQQGFEAIALANGGRILDADGNVVFDSPEIIEALEFYATLAQYNPPGKHNFGVPRDLYVNESVRNSFWSSFLMTPIFDGGGEELSNDTGTIKYLNKNQERINGAVAGLGVLNTENSGISEAEVEASIELIKWMHRPESYIPLLLTRVGGYRPIVEGILDSQQYQDSPVVQAWSDTMQQMSETLSSPKFTRFGLLDGQQFPELGNVTAQNIIGEAVVNVIDGGDAQQVASQYATRIEDAMSQ